jgi:Fe-S-cluster-containing dehydrogenase component
MSKRLGIVIDQDRCIGCEACSIACRIENNTSYFWINVDTLGGQDKDTPKGDYPNLQLHFLPKLCNHCEFPPCIDSCPVNAITKREDGLVILNQDECTGCKTCLNACPYNIIIFNEEKSIAEKCNLCSHRIEEGLEPFCVICCEGQALIFGDLNEPNSRISQLILVRKAFQLKSDDGTNPSIYYCPPRIKQCL